MKALALQALLTAVLVVAGLAAFDRWVLRPALRVGIVDVGALYREKEAEFTLILTRAGSDDERQRAMALARSFSQRLPLALDDLPHECGCLVVLRSAVAGRAPHTVDLTAHLRAKVDAP